MQCVAAAGIAEEKGGKATNGSAVRIIGKRVFYWRCYFLRRLCGRGIERVTKHGRNGSGR